MANAGVPLTQVESGFDEFVKRVNAREHIDAFTLARYRKIAETGLRIDPVSANIFLGGISAYEFDVESLHRYHKAAIRLSSNAVTHSNYSVSLMFVGLAQDAVREAVIAFEAEPENLTLAGNVVSMAERAGEIEVLQRFAKELDKRGEDAKDIVAHCHYLRTALAQRSVPESDYREGILIARSVLVQNHVRGHDSLIHYSLDSLEDDAFVIHGIQVMCGLDQAMQLQDELALRLADDLGERWRPDAVMFEYVPLE